MRRENDLDRHPLNETLISETEDSLGQKKTDLPSAPYQPTSYLLSAQQDVRQSFAADPDFNPLVSKKRSKHVRSLLATLILIASIVYPVYQYSEDHVSAANMWSLIVLGYIFYLLVGLCCNDLGEYFGRMQQGDRFPLAYSRARGLVGHFRMTAECYHYENQTVTRQVTDSNGQSKTVTETKRVKVVTHTASEQFVPNYTTDCSGEADRIRSQKTVVLIQFLVSYRFTDDSSRANVDRIFDWFKRNNCRDEFQDYTIRYDVPGLVHKHTFYVGELGCNYSTWLYILALLGLLWPYSLWVESKISRFNVSFMKILTVY